MNSRGPDDHEPGWDDWPLDEEFDMDEEETGGTVKSGSKVLLRLAAIIALVAFLAFSYAWLPLISPSHFDFLRQDEGLSSESLVKAAKPAVVTIKTVDANGMPGTYRNGTGFNIDSAGLIVTNRHVVESAASIEITFADERQFFSKDYQIIKGYDLATVKINGRGLPVLPLTSQMQAVGEEVTIIGNPLGYQRVSARGAVQGYYDGGEAGAAVFAILATAEPGSSGSPVINSQGEVSGIVYAITDIEQAGKKVRCSLAIPAAALRK